MINKHFYERLSAAELQALCKRSEIDISALRDIVRPIIDAVRKDGDASLRRFTAEFDGADLGALPIEVTPAEMEEGCAALAAPVREAIDVAARNIRAFHQAQMPEQIWLREVSPGVMAGEKITPITSIGLYVPRGKGAFPSVMLMLAIPAVVAGVGEIVVCTPPGKDGKVDPASLYAARAAGVKRIFRVGGAQAVAALAYGTQSVPRVRKVLGPGNAYVSAAKRELYGVIDVGVPAGPSESIILADASTPARIAASDLLIEAEHGPDSCALLVTDSPRLAEEVEALLPSLIAALPAERRGYCERGMAGYGGIVVTQNLGQAIDFVNMFAPEHLEVLTADPFAILSQIRNAGEILLGRHSVITIGNFCLGLNAVLPTGGFAHTFSCVTVFDYLKRSSIGYVNAAGYEALAPVARTLAEYEGFPAHAAAVTGRFG